MELVAQRGAQAHKLVAVNEQLPEIAFARRGNPDFRKTSCEQQIENQRGVTLIGFLLAHLTGANPCGVPDPQLVTELREQPFEPMNGPGSFNPHAHWRLQTPVEGVGFTALVIQPPLEKQLAGLFLGHGDLLIACMKITTYNQHCSAPFPEPWSLNSCQVYPVEGADAVIQSKSSNDLRPGHPPTGHPSMTASALSRDTKSVRVTGARFLFT